jgi:pyruvate kinase
VSILRERHARMLVTIGPASNSPEMLKKLVEAGADAFRLNFSHGSHDLHAKVIGHIRKIEEDLNHPITILQDLQGPKIRLGEMTGPQTLEGGDTFILDDDPKAGDKTRAHLPHPEIMEVLKAGDKIYINDGLVRLKVTEANPKKVTCEVTSGGVINSRKGVNLPGVDLPISSITQKDWEDLEFGLTQDIDWVAVSFVQRKEDVEQVKEKVNGKALVMAKIEMPNAVERIDSIIDVTDGIMVARGDLGVEMPLEEVPSIQKRLIRKCREAGKPIVVATQMLESMIHNPTPTRAEVSDVANATFEGADALMLSAESAAGNYPLEAVSMMSSIIMRVESSSAWQPLMEARHKLDLEDVSDAITRAAFTTASAIKAGLIVTFTESGATALRMSRQRPTQPILMVTPHKSTARKLGLGWGLHRFVGTEPYTQEDLVRIAIEGAEAEGLIQDGECIVITAGIPFGQSGSTNFLRVVNYSKRD